MPVAPDIEAELGPLVELGIAAARRGHHERARRYLEAALALDPLREEALLWLAAMTGDRDRASELVRRALQRDPSSPRAQAALRWLDQTAADTSTPPEAGSPRPFRPPWEAYAPGAPPRVPDDAHSQALPASLLRQSSEEPTAPQGGSGADLGAMPSADRHDTRVEPSRDHRPGRRRLYRGARARPRSPLGPIANVAMLAMLAVIVLGSATLGVLLTDDVEAQRARIALGAVTRTPTPSRTPTNTLTPTLTRTPAVTRTPTATVTPSLTPTLTPSPTSSPTATPEPTPTPIPEWVLQLGPLPTDEKWIEIDLTTQTLRAREGTDLVLTTPISSGRPGMATRVGRFRIQTKHRRQGMAGADYYLPNVPYVQYFVGGIALHGVYWSVNWGAPSSHGCVNLTREDAAWLFDWTEPPVPEDVNTVRATQDSPGTWVLVHK